MKRELSSGGVVFRREGSSIKVLLIKDSYDRWALPKGLVEEGETNEQAALREIQEETGLKNLEIVEYLGEVRYFYRLKKTKEGEDGKQLSSFYKEDYENISKTVKFFLVETKDSEVRISWEIKGAQWFSPEEALKKIEYKNTKEVMGRAVKLLNKKTLRNFNEK
jgi:8-oxo-dGTP pyrophosphatase MutT (NUDIX family)